MIKRVCIDKAISRYDVNTNITRECPEKKFKNIRNPLLDFFRLPAAMFVVFLHCKFPGTLGIYVQGLARFAVPFFFLISGYFMFNCRRDLYRVKKLTINQLRMCILMELLSMLSQSSLGIETLYKKFISFGALKRLCLGIYGTYGAGWFLYSLLICHVFAYAYFRFIADKHKMLERWVSILAYILLCTHLILNMTVMRSIESDMLVSNFWLMGFPIYYLGFKLHLIIEKNDVANIKMIGIVLLIIGIVETIFASTFLCSDLYIGSVLVAIGLLFYALAHTSNAFPGWFNSLGGVCKNLSFLIYILHLHVWRLLETSWRFSRMNYLKPIAVVAITVAFSALFVVGINKGE